MNVKLSQEKVNKCAFPKIKHFQIRCYKKVSHDDRLINLTSSKHDMTNYPYSHYQMVTWSLTFLHKGYSGIINYIAIVHT